MLICVNFNKWKLSLKKTQLRLNFRFRASLDLTGYVYRKSFAALQFAFADKKSILFPLTPFMLINKFNGTTWHLYQHLDR